MHRLVEALALSEKNELDLTENFAIDIQGPLKNSAPAESHL
jgi:hypothetical protein